MVENPVSSVHIDDMTSEHFFLDPFARLNNQEALLKDKDTMITLRNAISENNHLFAGKVVLDLRCGTGILSMFAAKAGAKRVFAMDSSNILYRTEKIVKDNGMQNIITIIKGDVEKIELPPEYPKVDVIICENMGYCLLYEGLLSIIIKARDKWLKPGGCLFPDRCCVYIAAIEDLVFKDRADWWNKVHGFDMSIMKGAISSELGWQTIDSRQTVTNYACLKRLDFYTAQQKDVFFSVPFTLQAIKNDYINGFITTFTVEFTKCHNYVGFTTAPFSRYNRWRQTALYIDHALMIKDKEVIEGQFCIKKNSKDIEVCLNVNFNGELTSVSFEKTYKT